MLWEVKLELAVGAFGVNPIAKRLAESARYCRVWGFLAARVYCCNSTARHGA